MRKLIVAFRKFSNAPKKLVWVRRPSVVVNPVTCQPGFGRLVCKAWLKDGEIYPVSSAWWLYKEGVLNYH